MAYEVRILADSVCAGARLTSFELCYPRFVHAEFMTHRQFSRNAASNRAIPIETLINRVLDDPAMPLRWGRNQAGMTARMVLPDSEQVTAQTEWLRGRDNAVINARRLASTGLHKQLVNRVLEPWSWITTLCSGTDYANFFAQRLHADAQPEIAHLARLMHTAYLASVPQTLPHAHHGAWHLPLIAPFEYDDFDIETLKKLCVARCARVSYLTHTKTRDIVKDLELFTRLVAGGNNGHWSPFEHVATPAASPSVRSGNFTGWLQFRKSFPRECIEQQPYAFPLLLPPGDPLLEGPVEASAAKLAMAAPLEN